MGKELEYKLSLPENCDREMILRDPILEELHTDAWRERHMQTTYYDSPDCRFSKHLWTLRHRMEGSESVVCVKTPTEDFHTRGEWQVASDRPDDKAMEQLLLAGAPKQLLVLYGLGDIFPICGADFIRKSVMLTFSDGSKAEFAFDCGRLHGKTEVLQFSEIELELYEGSPKEMLAFVAYLSRQYHLTEQRKSKFARARALT